MKRKSKDSHPMSPGKRTAPRPQQPQQAIKVYHIPFTIKEIDTVMQTLIEANVPIQTFMILDDKFRDVRRAASSPLVGGGERGKEVIVHQSKINEEATVIPDWIPGTEYNEGEKYVRRDPFGVFEIIKGVETEITVNQDLANNGPGETN